MRSMPGPSALLPASQSESTIHRMSTSFTRSCSNRSVTVLSSGPVSPVGTVTAECVLPSSLPLHPMARTSHILALPPLPTMPDRPPTVEDMPA